MLKKSTDIIKDIHKFILDNNRVNLVLTGGKSPLNLYKKLFAKKLDWKKVNLFISDERIVDSKNKGSNLFNIKKQLSKKNKYIIYPLSKNSTKKKVSNRIFKMIKNYKTISILGMGNDGHFASIFANKINYNKLIDINEKPRVFITEKVGIPKVKRVTFNLSGIILANKIYLIINNKTKKKILLKSSKLMNDLIPISHLIKNAKKKLFICSEKF